MDKKPTKSTAIIEILKSPNDFRAYRVVILPNGITSLLISTMPYPSAYDEADMMDNNLDEGEYDDGEAGAALCIGIGSFSDPDEIPGFAHFMEHMVFMGSKKYPKENHWDEFIAKNSGESNAWTDCERTCFFFEVNQGSFAKALDIFSQFFISPLFCKNSVDREIMAVDNECQQMSSYDSERTRAIISHLLVQEGHPMKKFMAGNRKSLKEDPQTNKVNVYCMLKKFYSQMYSAQYMTLVIHSMDDLDTMESKVLKIFSKIPNNQIPHPKFITPPFQEQTFNKFIRVVPVEDVRKLELLWAFPPLQDHYKTRIIEFLAVLLGHEGRGSILSVLKKKHYALEVSAGNDMTGYTHNSTCTMFTLSVKLTDQGAKAVDEVLETIFQYINILKATLPAYVFEEQRHIEETKYIFRDQEAVYYYVEQLAENMHVFPPEHYICGRKLFFEYNEQLIRDCVHFLRPQGMLMIQYDKSYIYLSNLKEEPWHSSKYIMSEIDPALIYKLNSLQPNPDLKLPEPNPYISTNFSILKGKRATKSPVVLYNKKGCRIWFKKDSTFATPKAYVYFNLISSAISRTSRNLAMGDVYLTMLLQKLTEDLYNAALAGYEYFVEGTPEGIIVVIGGYNEKIKLVVENLLKTFINIEIDEDGFTSVLEHVQQIYMNDLIRPIELAKAMQYSLLEQKDASTLERYDMLPCLTIDSLKEFVQEFHQNLFIEGFLIGNLKSLDAEDIGKLASRVVKHALPADKVPKPNMMELPNGEFKCMISAVNKEDPNSCVMQYFQQGPGTFLNASLNEMLSAAMQEPLFNNLRTEHQLGYSVFCQPTITHGVLGFIVVVESQANRHDMRDIDKLMTQFLKSFDKVLEDMPTAKFQDLLDFQMAMKSPEDADLVDESARLWGEIVKQTYAFEQSDKEFNIIEKITLKDLVKWFRSTILDESKRKLSIMVEGCSGTGANDCHGTPSAAATTGSLIDSLKRTCVTNVANSLFGRSKGANGDDQRQTSEPSEASHSHYLATLKNEGPDYIVDIGKFRSNLRSLPYHVISS